MATRPSPSVNRRRYAGALPALGLALGTLLAGAGGCAAELWRSEPMPPASYSAEAPGVGAGLCARLEGCAVAPSRQAQLGADGCTRCEAQGAVPLVR